MIYDNIKVGDIIIQRKPETQQVILYTVIMGQDWENNLNERMELRKTATLTMSDLERGNFTGEDIIEQPAN